MIPLCASPVTFVSGLVWGQGQRVGLFVPRALCTALQLMVALSRAAGPETCRPTGMGRHGDTGSGRKHGKKGRGGRQGAGTAQNPPPCTERGLTGLLWSSLIHSDLSSGLSCPLLFSFLSFPFLSCPVLYIHFFWSLFLSSPLLSFSFPSSPLHPFLSFPLFFIPFLSSIFLPSPLFSFSFLSSPFLSYLLLSFPL